MSKVIRRGRAAILYIFLSTGSAFAQGGADLSSPPAPSVADKNESAFEDIIVTARKREERFLDVPAAVTAVSSAGLERYNITTLAGISSLVPTLGLDRTYSGTGAVLAVRGVGSSFQDPGLEQSVLLNLDGVPISRGRIVNDAFFDIAGVEVLKGPQALFFGKNSPGGVVTILTKNPTDTLEGYGRIGYEFTTDDASFEGAVSGPLSNSLRARMAIYASRSEGYIKNRNPGILDPFVPGNFLPSPGKRLGGERKLAGRLTIQYDPGTDFDASLKLLASEFKGENALLQEIMSCPNGRTTPRTAGIPDLTGDCRLNGRTSVGTLPPSYFFNWDSVGNGEALTHNRTLLPILTMNYALGPKATVTSVTGLYRYTNANRGPIDGTALTSVWTSTHERNTTFTQELRLAVPLASFMDLSVGGYFEKGHRYFDASAVITRVPVDPATGRQYWYDLVFRNRNTAYSGFGQITLRPMDAFEIAGGARYSYESKKFKGVNTYVHPTQLAANRPTGLPLTARYKSENVSPEATVTWHVTPEFTAYAAYKTGYLSGGISNPGSLSAGATPATLTIDPTKAKGGEIGLKTSQFGGRLTADFTAYRYVYSGLQLTAFDTILNTFRSQNAANTVVKGLEFQGAWTVTDELNLRSAFAYNSARYTRFPLATCYGGQTAATGCVTVGGISTQDLSGKQVYAAPKYVWNIGATYRKPLTDAVDAVISADVRHKSSYYVALTQNPGALQKSFYLLDASIMLENQQTGWQLALLGRNLTNTKYGTLGADKPVGSGEVTATYALPRTIALQITKNF